MEKSIKTYSMDNIYDSLDTQKVDCLVCRSNDYKKLGIRGNREYSGANANAQPHVFTDVVKCNKCGFIYTNPTITGADRLEKLHYSSPDTYDATKEQDPLQMFTKRIGILKKHKASGKVLDIGAGKGEFMVAAKNSGYDTYGIEPSKGLCEYANEKNQLNVINGFLEDVSNPEKEYDLVTMNHVFEHIENPHETLELIKSFLKPDGMLFIEVPNTDSFFLKLIDFYYKIKRLNWSSRLSPLHPPFHKYGYNKAALTYILKEHNYNVESVYTLTGQDRGFEQKDNVGGITVTLRNLATNLVNLVGNRELIIILAKLN